MSSIFELATVHVTSRSVLEHLTLRQIALLARVCKEPGRSTNHLAIELGVAKPVITRGTTRLIEAGLLERKTSCGDRRRVSLHPTVAGERLVERGGLGL